MNTFKSNSMLLAAVGALAVGGLVLLPAGNAQANMITNGDFSANASSFTIAPGYYGDLAANNNPNNATGWTSSGNGGVNGTDTGTSVGNTFGPSSTSISTGGSVADFAFLQNVATLSQGLAAIAGQTYTVNLVAATRAGNTGAYMTAEVLDGATVLGGIGTSTPVNPGSTDFTPYNFSFTANGGNLTFEILNSPPGGTDESLAVSDVSISAVPEPATLGLVVAAGGLGLLLIGRKRRAQN
jgi:hypothetical protein